MVFTSFYNFYKSHGLLATYHVREFVRRDSNGPLSLLVITSLGWFYKCCIKYHRFVI
jgi:hypothetical protein